MMEYQRHNLKVNSFQFPLLCIFFSVIIIPVFFCLVGFFCECVCVRVFSLSLSTMSLAVVSKVLLRWSNVRVRAINRRKVQRNGKWVPCVNRGLCMCLMLCVSPGEGQSIQYYQIKKPQVSKSTRCLCVVISPQVGDQVSVTLTTSCLCLWVSFDLFPQSNDIHVNSAGDYKWPWM